MEIALMDVLIAMGIVSINPTLKSICGNVETNASRRAYNVMEPAQRKKLSAETTCASAAMTIPTAIGLGAIPTEIVTAPAFQTGDLVTGPVIQDITSATTPTADTTTNTQMA